MTFSGPSRPNHAQQCSDSARGILKIITEAPENSLTVSMKIITSLVVEA